MSTSALAEPEVAADHVQRFEKKIHEMKQAIARLPGEDYYAEILGIIRRPGWKTVAEGLFFEAVVDTILARTRDLEQLHHRLRKASEVV
jgi:hypothetical protein